MGTYEEKGENSNTESGAVYGAVYSGISKKDDACKSIHDCMDAKSKKDQRTPLYLFYAFAVGVSWAATFSLLMWMAWGYQKYQWKKENPQNKANPPPSPSITQAYLQTFLRLGFGLANIGNVLFGNTLCSAISFGILFGVVFSTFCFTHNLHTTLFQLKNTPVFYISMSSLIILIFVIILRTLNIKGFEMFALMGN